jgi:hypothetical protein
VKEKFVKKISHKKNNGVKFDAVHKEKLQHLEMSLDFLRFIFWRVFKKIRKNFEGF